METESFPRGGSTQSSKKRKLEETEEPRLFKESEKGTSTKKKTKSQASPRSSGGEVKRKKKEGRKQKGGTKAVDAQSSGVEPLYVKDMAEGMLVLGVVQEVGDFELIVSLPHGISGTVKITSIADSYTHLLQKLSEGGDSVDIGELGSLHELFRVGQVLKCKVTDVQKKKCKHPAVLSLNPRDVNENLAASKLSHGMVISGVVASKEDHGFVIDLGIKSLTAFLSHGAADALVEETLDGRELKVGQCLDCMIEGVDKISLLAGESRTISVTAAPRKVYRSALTSHMGVTFNSLVPGMIVEGSVSKVAESGVRVAFLGMKATIHRSHLEKPPKSLAESGEIKAAVLHIHPITKKIALTQLTHLVTPDLAPRSPFGTFAVGDIVEEAKVTRVDKKMGVYVRLSERVVGLAYVTQLSDKPLTNFTQHFMRGKTVRCRVIGLLYTDNVALVTFRQSVLEQKFLDYANAKPGEIVMCEVHSVHKRGLVVKIGKNIRGFIPLIHLAEFPVSKNVEARFTQGDQLKCRVLKCNPEERRLILTNKKAMLRSQAPVVTCYEQVRADDILEGFVVCVRDNGLVVAFYNDVKGWVPKRQLSSEPIEYPDKVFYEGQVVKCRVKEVNVEESKLLLSFVLEGKKPFGQKAADLPDDFEIGKIVSCTVAKKQENGFDVILQPSEKAAFLPRVHLSDELSLCDALWDAFQEGDSIEQVVYYSKKNVVVVSRKNSLITAGEEGNLIQEFSQLVPNMVIPGVVKQLVDYGLFVEVNGELRGLVPRKYISDRVVGDPLKMFAVGQSVLVTVMEVHPDKERFLLSLRLSDCHPAGSGSDASIEVIDAYLRDYHLIRAKYEERKGLKAAIAKLSMGDVVMATVTDVSEHGALFELCDGVKGFAMYEHMKDLRLNEGKQVQVVVLYVDFDRQIAELACSPKFVSTVKSFTDNKFSAVTLGQVLKSDVILIKNEFAVVMLKGNSRGRLAYVPTRQIYNDVLGKRPFVIGQINAVVVKRLGGEVRACLKLHDSLGAVEKTRPKSSGHDYAAGDVDVGVVEGAGGPFVDIALGGSEVRAHAHISQLADDIPEGTNPMDNFQKGRKVRAMVTGYREKKRGKHVYLPVSRSRTNVKDLVVTLKPSIVQEADVEKKKKKMGVMMFKEGQKVDAFFMMFKRPFLYFHLAPNVLGRVASMNASDDVTICSNPHTHFKLHACYKARVLRRQVKDIVDISIAEESAEIKEGAVVKGRVVSKSHNYGLILQLADGYKGTVHLTDVSDEYEDNILARYHVHNVCWCYVLAMKGKRLLQLSMRHSRTQKGESDPEKVKDMEVLDASQLKVGNVIRGYVTKATEDGVMVAIGNRIVGKAVQYDTIEPPQNDPLPDAKPGKCVVTRVTGIFGRQMGLSLLDHDSSWTEGPLRADDMYLNLLRKRTASEPGKGESRAKRPRTDEETADAQESEKREEDDSMMERAEDDSGVESDNEPVKQVENSEERSLEALVETGFSWSTDFQLPPTSQSTQSDDDAESEEEEGDSETAKQKTAEDYKAEEKMIYLRERQLLDEAREPAGTEDYERLVLQSPDSSLVWLRFLAYHVEAGEMDRARMVAERALKTISFREEQEKLNVWVAYLNLENMYGDHESLKEVFDRALQYNDPLKVFNQLIHIYVTSGKTEAAEQLHGMCIKRFGHNKDVWVNFGLHYFKTNKPEAARKLLKRSFTVLEQKHHAEVIGKFAQMEFRYGEPGHGISMFENVLSTYPKRTDLWSVYIDMVVKSGDTEAARKLYERLTDLSLSAKKMKFCFKKFVEFEEKYGDEGRVAHVKQKAVQYVENKGEVTS